LIVVPAGNVIPILTFTKPKVHPLPSERTYLATDAVIAIVDDDDLIRESLAGLFRSFDIHAEAFASAASFLSEGVDRFDIVVSDLQMPGMSGLDLWRMLSQRAIPLPVIIITAYPERAVDGSRSSDALHLLEKPIDSAQLITCIEKVLGRPIT
jgi:FixJ family two-component response regulator